MKRFGVLAALVIAALSAVLAAQRGGQQPRPKVRAIQHIKDNLYFIPGSDRDTYNIPGSGYDPSTRTATTGGNTAVFVMDTGVVLVDTMNPGYGAEILAQVQSVTSKPVTTIINTHNHFDHTGSNIDFPASVETVVHDNAKANLSQATCPPVTNCSAFKGENSKFLPRRTYKDKLTLFQGKDRVELYHFGRGHTSGDTFVVFPTVRAMHTGDMFQRKNMPFIDATNNGGNALEFTQTLNRAAAGIKGVETVIPGHSPTLLTWNDFKEYTEYYGEFVNSVRSAMKAGKSVDEAASAYKPTGKYSRYETESGRVKQNAESIYASSKDGR
jgi:glyoxylase-like metal-dependent hydrolase (beta-lactamase superfamily II)